VKDDAEFISEQIAADQESKAPSAGISVNARTSAQAHVLERS
jgi:hypothetical protein